MRSSTRLESIRCSNISIEFPDGRLQALSIAWDARPKKDGGQRWFHLYPNERVTYDDELHWTRPSQNWNFMCADCHSTDVRKNYDPVADQIPDPLGGNQRGLRSMSRPRFAPSGVGRQVEAEREAFGK